MKRYKHRIPRGMNISKTKAVAMKDISAECGENKFYTRNYLPIERSVLDLNVINYKRVSL